MWFDALVFVVAFFSAGIASIVGFGIGSLLTPTLGMALGTKIAVAAVSVPHLVGTAIRFWMLRDAINASVLWRFGIASAGGGLSGALLHGWANNPRLSVLFGAVLLFVASSEFTGLARRMTFHGPVAWIAGVLSGLLGGLVGNQGGIRSAALLGFDLQKRAFVATATATGLIVDLARMPVYLATVGRDVMAAWPLVAIATTGVVLGTFFGAWFLRWIPEAHFRKLVALVLGLLGAVMLVQGARG